jgi:CheY-like chemotaxis protein
MDTLLSSALQNGAYTRHEQNKYLYNGFIKDDKRRIKKALTGRYNLSDEHRPAASDKAINMTALESQPCSILLVDDEADLLTLFEIALVRLNCALYKAESGRRALEILSELVPTLIVLDLAMPEVSGIDVLEAIRSDPAYDQTKIVVLTAVPLMLERRHVSMVDMVLTKPVTPRSLESIIRNLLSG